LIDSLALYRATTAPNHHLQWSQKKKTKHLQLVMN